LFNIKFISFLNVILRVS